MRSSFRVYIDESGDEGFVFRPNGSGSSRWLVLSAVVTRTATDLETVKLLDGVRATLGRPERSTLHFRELKHEQKIPYVRAIATASLRTVSVLVHKPSLSEPETFQAEKFRLYFYVTRYLLERVSWLCRDHRRANEGDGTAEVIFSNRSYMSYDAMRAYLCRLRDNADTRIDWSAFDPDAIRAVNHEKMMGLQLADAVASSLYFAVNLNRYGETEERYASILGPTMYRHRGTVHGYGLKFWPGSFEQLKQIERHLQALDPLMQ